MSWRILPALSQGRDEWSSSSSDSSSSSSSKSSIAPVFREATGDPDGKLWVDLMARARKYPGALASESLQSMDYVVGRDCGEDFEFDPKKMPAVAKAYYQRVLKDEFPPTQKRDRRELLTLCTILDKCAKGRSDLPLGKLIRWAYMSPKLCC